MDVSEEIKSVLQVFGGLNVLLILLGQSLIETGETRYKNVVTALTKQITSLLVCITVYWLFGFAFTFGGRNGFIGYKYFALDGADSSSFEMFFLHTSISALPSSIVSGTILERSQIGGHLILSFLISGLIYPVCAHWIWDDQGWLKIQGCIDNGGVLPLHVLSGTIALLACIIIGRRVEKFGDQYRRTIKGHSLTMSYLGGLLSAIGMIGRSVGVTAASGTMPEMAEATEGGGSRITMGSTVMNCMLSGSASGLVATLLYKISSKYEIENELDDLPDISEKLLKRHWSLFCGVNGFLAGLVGVQGGVGIFPSWAAWIVGLVAGILYFSLHFVLKHCCRLDDGISAISIHLGAGVWGAISAPLFANPAFLVGSRGVLFGRSVAGVLATIVWALITSVLLLLLLLIFGLLRLHPTVETIGADFFVTKEQEVVSEGGQMTRQHGRQDGPMDVALRPTREFANVSCDNEADSDRSNNKNKWFSKRRNIKSTSAISTEKLGGSRFLVTDLSASVPKVIWPEEDCHQIKSTNEELKNTIIIIPPPPPPPSTPTDSQMPRTSTTLSSTDLPLAIKTRTANLHLDSNDPSKPANLQFGMDVEELRETLQIQKKRLKNCGSSVALLTSKGRASSFTPVIESSEGSVTPSPNTEETDFAKEDHHFTNDGDSSGEKVPTMEEGKPSEEVQSNGVRRLFNQLNRDKPSIDSIEGLNSLDNMNRVLGSNLILNPMESSITHGLRKEMFNNVLIVKKTDDSHDSGETQESGFGEISSQISNETVICTESNC